MDSNGVIGFWCAVRRFKARLHLEKEAGGIIGRKSLLRPTNEGRPWNLNKPMKRTYCGGKWLVETQDYATPRFALARCLGTALVLCCTAGYAADVFKANNTDNLSIGSSWSGGSAPTSGDVGVWDNSL